MGSAFTRRSKFISAIEARRIGGKGHFNPFDLHYRETRIGRPGVAEMK
jgi:hypothetical protein